MKPAAIRKFIVAALGLGLILAVQVFDLVVPSGLSDAVMAVVDGVLGLLTAFGVFQVPNDPVGRNLKAEPLGAPDPRYHGPDYSTGDHV